MSEFRKSLLSALMVRGAQSEASAVDSKDLASELGLAPGTIEAELKDLIKAGYAQRVQGDQELKVFLTGTGVITASSTYS